jgi:hypothetical protein
MHNEEVHEPCFVLVMCREMLVLLFQWKWVMVECRVNEMKQEIALVKEQNREKVGGMGEWGEFWGNFSHFSTRCRSFPAPFVFVREWCVALAMSERESGRRVLSCPPPFVLETNIDRPKFKREEKKWLTATDFN